MRVFLSFPRPLPASPGAPALLIFAGGLPQPQRLPNHQPRPSGIRYWSVFREEEDLSGSDVLTTESDSEMTHRPQQTIERVTQLRGFGLFTNADVCVRFLPAGEHQGIVFERTDLPDSPRIPANIACLAAEDRRTKLVLGPASIEMTEHLLAALAGLQIDNCLIQVDAPELPGCDGSALPYAEALLDAGIVAQSASRACHVLQAMILLDDQQTTLVAEPYSLGLRISYDLNYGPGSPIPPQLADFTLTPETFISKIAPARTFVLEQEIAYLRSKGYGQRVTASDLVVYGSAGPVGNSLRAHNECARHKLLDCLGDLLLCGCDVQGHIRAFRTGHRHNHQLARAIADRHAQQRNTQRRAA